MTDLRPIPRLPLDRANVTVIKEGDLNGVIVDDPVDVVFQISLLETKTPHYYAGTFNREVYDRQLTALFPQLTDAETVARKTLLEFNKETPRPPQWRGIIE